MYMNGVRTGMATIVHTTQITQRDLHRALAACFVAAAGTLVQDTAAFLFATAVVLAAVAAFSASASSASLSLNTKNPEIVLS